MTDEKQTSNEVSIESLEHAPVPPPTGELVLGTVIGIDENGHPQVSFNIDEALFSAVEADSTVPILPGHVGRQVAIMFLKRDIAQPVIIGMVHTPLFTVLEAGSDALSEDAPLAIEVDGEPRENVSIEGKEEVVLRCGDASITLTKEGKILLRGKYLVSRSSGVNRILGGSVQVN